MGSSGPGSAPRSAPRSAPDLLLFVLQLCHLVTLEVKACAAAEPPQPLSFIIHVLFTLISIQGHAEAGATSG